MCYERAPYSRLPHDRRAAHSIKTSAPITLIAALGGDVAVLPMPGAALVLIQSQLVFCRLETVLDGPAAALHTHQFLDCSFCRSQVEKKARS